MTGDMLAVLAARYLLVMLFFPFSALDKMLNFNGAVGQAQEVVPRGIAVVLIVIGLCIEIVMPLAILTGVADRLAALVMACYCTLTALLWKRFWTPGDFWVGGDSKARGVFWDFLKNCGLAGGFLLLVVGAHGSLGAFTCDPLGSSHPYANAVAP